MRRDDVIKRKLTNRLKPVVEPSKKKVIQVEIPRPTITVKDVIITDNFLTHLNRTTIENYLTKDNSDDLRKKLIIADLYAKHHGDTGIYEHLADPSISISSWVIYVSKKIEKNLFNFAFSLYEKKPLDKKTYGFIIEQIVDKLLNTDIAKTYSSSVNEKEYNLLVLCDNLLLIQQDQTKRRDMYESVREKMAYVNLLFNSYRLPADANNFDALYLLRAIPDLK